MRNNVFLFVRLALFLGTMQGSISRNTNNIYLFMKINELIDSLILHDAKTTPSGRSK
jgi:hypothetical protein